MTDAVCPFCHRSLPDEMSVLVNLDGSLTVVCWNCYERGDEAARTADEPDEELVDAD